MFDFVGVLDWCFWHFYNLDRSNAAIHLSEVKFSPITFRLAWALNDATGSVHRDEVAEVIEHTNLYPEDKGR